MTTRRSRLGLAALVSGCFGSTLAYAQASDQQAAPKRRQIEELVVTATKRSASTQDIPVAVNALGSQTLEQLDVDNFTDYLQQLPGVTAGGSGPGTNTIYIRGLASTTPNLTTAGVAGLAPNVALYLDEQPVSQPGRNLDIYAVDLERVEVLAGPQGTLFGASSQAGTVRLITKKPQLNEFSAEANFGLSFTRSGEMSNKAEGIVNFPVLEDKLAVRLVGYNDTQGGFIDNVAGTRDASEGGRFRPEGTVRANGVPVADFRAGFQSTADLSDVEFLEANNNGLVEDDFNDANYAGFRASALWAINPDWTLTVSHSRQSLETEGVFFVDPELDEDLAIQRFEEDELEDDYGNTAWTLEGRVAALDIVYTGSFTDRDTEQRIDYSDYLFVGQYLPYYICDASVTYPGDGVDPSGTCQPPNLFVDSSTETQIFTHELRFTTPETYRIYATAGAFYSDLEITEINDFTYPGSVNVLGFDGVSTGFAPNFPLTNAAATPGDVGDESQGFFTDPGPFPEGVIFRNDVQRTDEQFGIFGEVTFDVLPNTLSLIFGARYFDVEVDLVGSANSSFFNLGSDTDAQVFGTNISAQFAPDNPFGAPDTASTDGVIFKGTANWTPTEDLLFYFTFSEGFRPGLLNRPGGADGPDGFTVPFALDTDEVQNFEIGWKMDLLQNSLRFNGNAFFVDISNLQTTIFDPSITNLFFSANAADAEIMGIEGDISYYPPAIPGLSAFAAFSILDTEITDVLIPTGDVIEGEELAFAPNFQGTLRLRYEWDVLDDYTAHVMSNVVYTGSSRSDIIEINAVDLDEYVTLGLSAGLTTANWSVEVFGENLNDTRGEISNDFVFDRERTTIIRPRTFGLRVGFRY